MRRRSGLRRESSRVSCVARDDHKKVEWAGGFCGLCSLVSASVVGIVIVIVIVIVDLFVCGFSVR